MTDQKTPNTNWQLTQGDSLRLLQELPDCSVDAVITDPPYSSGGAFRADRQRPTSSKYVSGKESLILPEFYGDSRTERGLLLWSSLWLAEAWRVTVPGGAIAVFCDWRSLPTVSDAIQVGGWSWRGTGVWVKPLDKSRPIKGGLWNDTEYILWASRGPRVGGDYLPGSWSTAAPSSTTRQHPTEKPQVILDDLVRLAPEGGTILDPFAGSSATGVSALRQRRKFIGFELSHDYAERGRKRLSEFTAHGADTSYSEPGLFTIGSEP